MVSRRDIAAPAAPAATNTAVVNDYLMALSVRLRGPARARAIILDEIRAQLDEATDVFTSHGLPEPIAANAAIVDIGSPANIARSFAGELATLQARRMLWTLLLTGPLVGGWWFLLLAPTPWQPHPETLIAAIPVLPLVAAAIGTAIVVIATTGSLIRWLPEAAPRRALSAAIAVALACVLGDVTVLSILVGRIASDPSNHFPILLAIGATTASSIRLVGSSSAIRQCLRILSALNKADAHAQL